MHTSGHRTLRTLAFAGAAVVLLLAPLAASAFECSAAPQENCRATTRPTKSKLNLRNGIRPERQKLVWKWFRGEATPVAAFGDPTTTESYAVCMYDGADQIVYQSVVPAGATCRGGNPCWKQIGDRGFAFRDGQARWDGLTKIRLVRGEEGQARIILKGSGANLDLADLPLGLPTDVQLQASHGECWEAFFNVDGARRNNDTRFGGRSSRP